MKFKETLKDELKYQDIKVKELSEMTGIPKGTIDHYLAEKNTLPLASALPQNAPPQRAGSPLGRRTATFRPRG